MRPGPPPTLWAQACARQRRPPTRSASGATRMVTGLKTIRLEMPAVELLFPSVFSHGLSQKRLDHFGSSLTDCSLHFILVSVKNERSDMVCVKPLKVRFIRVVISFEDRHALEFRLFKKL